MPADGHCATNDETITVSLTSGTLPSTSIPAGKNLLVISGLVAGTLDWNLAGRTTPMTIAGQPGTTAEISSSSGAVNTVRVTGTGDLHVKNLGIRRGGSAGLRVESGATIHLDHVTVSDNPGNGIVIDNGGFEIRNTTVKGNGSGGGDGVYLTNLPASGKPKLLTNVSVTENTGNGVFCYAAKDTPSPASGIYLYGNRKDIEGCTFATGATCTTPGGACGAQ
jgi:hypothetical protein